MPHYDIRHAINVNTNKNGLIANNTLTEKVNANEDLSFGDNVHYNDTDTRRFHLMINGDDEDVRAVNLTGIRCFDNDCGATTSPDHDEVADESEFRLWSNLADWDGRTALPADDDEIIIPAHWKMYYDIEVDDSPRLKSLEINGDLIFLEGSDRILKTYNLWVRSGYLQVGNETHPFPD